MDTGLKELNLPLLATRNTLNNVVGVKTHLSVSLPQSVSISGAEINLTLRAVTTYLPCCNLAPSMSALKMCVFSKIATKWHYFCCGLGHTGKIWWQFFSKSFSCNKACSKYHTRSTNTPKYTLPKRLVVGDSTRGQLGRHGSTPVSTLLPKSVGFFIINIFLVIIMLSKLKSGKCWTRLASYPLHYENWPWWNNPPICKASSEENGTGQYPEPQERGL